MLNSMHKSLFRFGFAVAFGVSSWSAAADDLVIGSWNIRHLGHGDAKDFHSVAHVASGYDLLAVQEAMTERGLKRLERALEEATGEPWGLLHSHRIGRGSYKEMYAYIWRENRVDYLDGAVVYIDDRDRFAREPFSARFATADGSERWVMASVHVLYGDSRSDRAPEARALANFWDWLREAFPDDRSVILAGDFNLPPDDRAFRPLKERAQPLITRGATTLSSINGRYANLYDNLFVSRDHSLDIVESGIDRFPARMGWTHEAARRHVSDHAPVFVRVSVDGSLPPRSTVSGSQGAIPEADRGAAEQGSHPAIRVLKRLVL